MTKSISFAIQPVIFYAEDLPIQGENSWYSQQDENDFKEEIIQQSQGYIKKIKDTLLEKKYPIENIHTKALEIEQSIMDQYRLINPSLELNSCSRIVKLLEIVDVETEKISTPVNEVLKEKCRLHTIQRLLKRNKMKY
jgi:hypothetical protein